MTGVTGSTRVQKAVASARGHLAVFRRKGVTGEVAWSARQAMGLNLDDPFA